jgi:hypothetical protein
LTRIERVPEQPDRLLTPMGAAERLAVKRSTIYECAAQRKIELKMN